MSVRYRPDRDKWMATVTIRGKRKRPLFRTKREAEEFERKCRLGRIGLKEDRQSITLAESFASYFEHESKRKSRVSMHNDSRYINLSHHFLVVERNVEFLEQVELQDLEALQRWLKQPHKLGDEVKSAWSTSTVNRCFHTLKHFFSKQVLWGKIAADPSLHLSQLPEDEKHRRPMTKDEFETLLELAPDWFKPALRFMRITAARPSSVARLQWRHVDLARRRLLLESRKGAKAQVKVTVVPIIDETFRILIQLRNQWPFAKDHHHVFRNESQEPLSAEWMSKVGNRLIKAAGLKDVVLYGLRHSLASDLTEAGIPTEVVRQALGHASIRTTQGYARGVSLDAVARAVDTVRGLTLPPNAPEESEDEIKGG